MYNQNQLNTKYNLCLTNLYNDSLSVKSALKSVSGMLIAITLILFIGKPLDAQTSLKELAAPKKVYIGNLISNDHLDDPANFRNGLADVHLRQEYNAVVLENYMKMAFILPSTEPDDIHNLTVEQLRATLTEENIEAFLSNENWADLRKRGHAMIWFNQAPDWLNLVGPTWTGQEVFDFTRKYILALGQICGDRVDEWDVINEAISDDAPNGQRIWRRGTWYRRANDGSMTDWGEATYENYIKMVFVWAREAQPSARLHINDYGIELFDTSMASKNRFMRDQAKALKVCGAPIDGVGFQSHLILSEVVSPSGVVNQGFIDAVEQSIEDLASADLEVAITELDIRICDNDRDEAFQEVAYRAYCEMALSQPNCHEILFWGLRDEDNWITLSNAPFFINCQDASIVEGDDYTPKPAYDGVADAISALTDQDEFGFAPLNPGDGSPANCGGMASLDPAILSIAGPAVVSPGEQVTVDVSYLATDDQDIVVWFQLDTDPFSVFTQVRLDVNAGSGMLNAVLDIPIDITAGTNVYRYLAFIAPDGEDVNNSFSELIQNQITVLGEDSQLIISSVGPESVSPGDSATIDIDYIAAAGQEIVVWLQLDQSPFTTFQEFRQTATEGRNTMTAKLYIPLDVPIANDAYQYQTILVPTGGGWPERISNLAQQNIDVVRVTSVNGSRINKLQVKVFPNPTAGFLTVKLPTSNQPTELLIYSTIGEMIHRQTVGPNVDQLDLELTSIPSGIYWLSIRRDTDYGVIRFLKQ
ncbi:MAG: endo-1,4-beta-xylanase [Bacteroidota bacterium]